MTPPSRSLRYTVTSHLERKFVALYDSSNLCRGERLWRMQVAPQCTAFVPITDATVRQARLGDRPSKKSIKRMVETIHALTARTGTGARHRRVGGEVEPHAARMGELLQCRHRHQDVSGDRQLHRCAVAPLVAHQAQDGSRSSVRPLARSKGPWSARRGIAASNADGQGRNCPPAECERKRIRNRDLFCQIEALS